MKVVESPRHVAVEDNERESRITKILDSGNWVTVVPSLKIGNYRMRNRERGS